MRRGVDHEHQETDQSRVQPGHGWRQERAAQSGPVYITDRGRPSHVLLSFESYKRLAANQTTMIELLSEPRGIEDIDFEIPVIGDAAQPARFD